MTLRGPLNWLLQERETARTEGKFGSCQNMKLNFGWCHLMWGFKEPFLSNSCE